jgi:hypothetical protein
MVSLETGVGSSRRWAERSAQDLLSLGVIVDPFFISSSEEPFDNEYYWNVCTTVTSAHIPSWSKCVICFIGYSEPRTRRTKLGRQRRICPSDRDYRQRGRLDEITRDHAGASLSYQLEKSLVQCTAQIRRERWRYHDQCQWVSSDRSQMWICMG